MTVIPLQFDPNLKPTGLGTTDSAVSYNGFKFPPCLKSKATITPVYDDAKRMVKYMRLEFRITFVLFHGLNLGTSGTAVAPDHSTDLYSGGYVRGSNAASSVKTNVHTVDEEMNYLRSRLSEPGQPFVFYLQGIGTVSVNDGTTPHYDVDNGPKPQVISWKPLTNKCCHVEWGITTCYSACNETSNSLTIAQFPFSVHFGINERGLTTRTVTGKLETALTRVPDSDITHGHAGISRPFEYTAYRDQIISAFPLISRFQRSQSYTLSEDRKTVEFSITDTEIDSDEAYGEGCQHERARLTVSNPMEMAFSIWDVTLSGQIDVMPGYTKAYAIAEMNRLFTRYYFICAARAKQLKFQSPTPETVSPGDSSDPAKYTDSINPTHVLTHMDFSDDIFGRSITFTFRWKLYTKLSELLSATGLFIPARASVSPDNAPDPTQTDITGDDLTAKEANAWDSWKTSLGTFLDVGGYSNLAFNQDDDVIVSLCTDWQQGAPAVMDSHTPLDDINERGNDPKQEETKAAADCWHAYQPRFDLEVIDHVGVHHPLNDYVPSAETALSPNAAVINTTFDPSMLASVPDITQAAGVHARREPAYILHFSGYADRLNFQIPVPRVEQAYGCAVRRVGTQEIRPRYLGNAIDPVNGKSYKRYGLMWKIQYALIGTPSNSTIKTDAHRDIYGVA